jgi:hypothetical protein
MVKTAVDLLLEEHSKHQNNPYMFPSPKTGRMYHPDSIVNLHKKILKDAGLPHIRFHDLRHPYVKHTTKNIILKSRKPKLPILVLIVWVFCFCFLFYDFARSIGGIIPIISFKDYFCCSTTFFAAEI